MFIALNFQGGQAGLGLFNLGLGSAGDCFNTRSYNRQGIEASMYDYGEPAPSIIVSVPPVYIEDVCENLPDEWITAFGENFCAQPMYVSNPSDME